MVNALILSGDRGEDGKSKALLKISSRYMVEYVIDSLKQSGCVNRIFIVGDEVLKKEIGHLVDGIVEPGNSIIENIRKGIEEIGDYKTPLIVCTSDIPMVNGEAIRDFVDRCREKGLELGYPIIDKRLNDEKYPEVKRTYVKMKEGTFTGGNILYMHPSIVERCTEKADKLVEYRKKPFKMGKVLGFTFLLRLAIGMLSIPAVEKKIYEMFSVKGSAIDTPYPEIGNDVDKADDVEFVLKHINKTA
ncbi:hypothetical protein Q428_00365 [Fervidicella metallireducens AeB]|uniref:MobA-like NTP transferase domain-containing protein n=1 Tax=Fervidicella metallireducens AeB TaxID=1403537 RepID=A0A017RYW5_9CLOT|nr:NTP transferase domain-containing protein [Fervidicella metallireducens]EYE89786.1 hypothetical protein Q428_00365 [Fervidicella metallireducens AeB]